MMESQLTLPMTTPQGWNEPPAPGDSRRRRSELRIPLCKQQRTMIYPNTTAPRPRLNQGQQADRVFGSDPSPSHHYHHPFSPTAWAGRPLVPSPGLDAELLRRAAVPWRSAAGPGILAPG